MAKISKKRFNEIARKYHIFIGDEKVLDVTNSVLVTDFINALNDEVNKPENKWIPWSGGNCPVDPETKINVKLANGSTYKNELARNFFWKYDCDTGNIISYKVVEN